MNKFSVVPCHFLMVTKGALNVHPFLVLHAIVLIEYAHPHRIQKPSIPSNSRRAPPNVPAPPRSQTNRDSGLCFLQLCVFVTKSAKLLFDDKRTRITGGDRSGASQPHKHVQFMPIEPGCPPIEALAHAEAQSRAGVEGMCSRHLYH